MHNLVDSPTLYDIVERYGWTMSELLGNYPIWDESARDELNNEIYLYFEYRQIGSETPQMFASFAGRTMNRVMPKVNAIAGFYFDVNSDNQNNWMYSGGQETSATSDTTYDSAIERTPDLETTVDSETESKATALVSDTPQVQLVGTENYMSALNESGSSGTSGSTTTQTGSETTEHTGKDSVSSGSTTTMASGQLSELASRWAETFPDLLGIIFDALEVCFCQVY